MWAPSVLKAAAEMCPAIMLKALAGLTDWSRWSMDHLQLLCLPMLPTLRQRLCHAPAQ